MTIDKDFKKIVRAHASKTGKSYATARADLASPSSTVRGVVPGAFPPDVLALANGLGVAPNAARDLLAAMADPDVGAVLRELHVATPFGVVTRKSPAIGASADLAIAQRQAADGVRNPTWYAESGAAEQIVPEGTSRKLLRYGAVDGIRTQVFRSSNNDVLGRTFSEQCRACRSWVWLGNSERQATCKCGQTYRVAFDLARVFAGTGMPGKRCLNCGKDRPEESAGWEEVNEWQCRCDKCSSVGPRHFAVSCDYETPEHAAASGVLQVIELTEDGQDVTDLVDQGILFIDLDHLRRHLQERLGGEVKVVVEEVR